MAEIDPDFILNYSTSESSEESSKEDLHSDEDEEAATLESAIENGASR